MNQEEIGKKIREIRTKANLSQQKFAEKYGVTYQAVSKWETGKSIPDIMILKEICNDYKINLDDILGEEQKTKKKKLLPWIILGIGILLVLIRLVLLFMKDDASFEFKTLSTTCDNFTISGNIAYNDKKSSIYIAKIDYCGKEDKEEYVEIECILYETDHKIKKEISRYTYNESKITLEEFLKKVNFTVSHYEKECRVYKENSIHLEISAKNQEGKITSYQVPLKLEEECKN